MTGDGPGEAQGSPQHVAVAVLARVGAWVERTPLSVLVPLAMGFAALRAGVAGVGPNFYTPLTQAAQALPQPVNGMSSDLGPAILRRLVGGGTAHWWAAGAVFWAAAVAGLMVLAGRRLGPWSRPSIVLVAMSVPVGVTVTLLGFYDIFTMTGAVLVALARRWWVALLGALVMVLSNPEHTILASLALLVVALGLRLRRSAMFAAAALAVGLAGSVLVNQWLAHNGVANPRVDMLATVGVAFDSVRLFLGSWPLALYAFLGALWLPTLATLAAIGRWPDRLIAAAGAIGVPAAASVLTLDGTRVFAAIGTGALVLLFRGAWASRLATPPRAELLGLLVLLFVALPLVVVYPDLTGTSYLRLPYDDLLTFIGWRPGL